MNTFTKEQYSRLATMGQSPEAPAELQGRSGGRRLPNPRPTRTPRRGAEDDTGEDPEPVFTSDESELEWEKERRTWRLRRARSAAGDRILPGIVPVFEEAKRNPRGSGETSAAMAVTVVKMWKLEADRLVAVKAPRAARVAAREEYEAAKAARIRMQQRAAMAAMHELQSQARRKEEAENRWRQELQRAEAEERAAWNRKGELVKMWKLEADRLVAVKAPRAARVAAREEYEAAKAARIRMQQRAAMAAMHELQSQARRKEEAENRSSDQKRYIVNNLLVQDISC
ncbi:uncharacterized protein Dyak_GE19470 [Drosophila yakuba]|uniref:Uncharacterized protein n=1 Tax=Drosophila yakuba TaxID=7245 RepID=B4PJ76_DROYA|nr:uncharacterized protein Dyak_GE19470 [Drosophila yakuba]